MTKLNEMAEEYVERSFQNWKASVIRSQNPTIHPHDSAHAFKAGYLAALESSEELVDAATRLKFVLEGGMPRPPATADSVASEFLSALAAFRKMREGVG